MSHTVDSTRPRVGENPVYRREALFEPGHRFRSGRCSAADYGSVVWLLCPGPVGVCGCGALETVRAFVHPPEGGVSDGC